MQSKLAEKCREEVVDICRQMSPAERLEAFVNHSRTLAQVRAAGEAARTELHAGRNRPPAHHRP